MVRFIRVGNQIIENEDAFAFYDTVVDDFVSFSGCSVFSDIDEFKLYSLDHELYERCLGLIPEDIFSP